jgi:hypothetical protein
MVGGRKEYTASLKETVRPAVKVKSEKTKESFFSLRTLHLCCSINKFNRSAGCNLLAVPKC